MKMPIWFIFLILWTAIAMNMIPCIISYSLAISMNKNAIVISFLFSFIFKSGYYATIFSHFTYYQWTKKWSNFDLKSWVTGGNKIRPRIPSKWRIFLSNWLSLSTQVDSNILQLLEISDRILVPPVTQFF